METIMEEKTETADLKVNRVVDRPVAAVWEALMKPGGTEALLGPGGQLGNKGENWASSDGTYGITRSFHPMEQIRFSWHESDGAPATRVDLQLHGRGDATELNLTHELLPEGIDRDSLTRRWNDALDRIAASV